VSEPPSGTRLRTSILASALQPWADVAEKLHRRLLHFADHEEGWEILWVGAGAARAATWWVSRSGGHAAAVDPNPGAVAWAERAARAAGAGALLTLHVGSADNLPHSDEVYDLVVMTLGFDPGVDPAAAVVQAARVVRPLRPVVLAVPIWTGTPDPRAETALDALGVRPRFLTAWKQVARDAGLVEVTAEGASEDGRWLAEGTVKPLARAWQSAGLDGVRTLLSAPVRTLRRLVRRRVIDLAMVRGVRWTG
jgi:SAM-dependent methyltransferase